MRRVLLLGAVLLAACTPQQQAFNPPIQSPAISATGYIAADAVTLPLKRWLPKSKPKAIVLALHGFNDYSNAFTPSGEYFRKSGIATYAYDQRGFGASPETGIWAGEDNLVRDVDNALATLAKKHPRTPIFLMGESMGGAVAMLAASRAKLPIRGIILSSPACSPAGDLPKSTRDFCIAVTTGSGRRRLARNITFGSFSVVWMVRIS